MAEEVRRRVAALRLAALLAVAITVGGLTTRQPIASAPGAERVSGLTANSVGSRQVIDHSLQSKDIKVGELLTPEQAAAVFVKFGQAEKIYLHKTDAASMYIKIDTPIDAWKLEGIPASGFVQGQGSVHTGLVQLAQSATGKLLDIPGLVGVVVAAGTPNGGRGAQLTNTSGETLTFSAGGKTAVVDNGGTTSILIGLDQPTLVQIIAPTTGRVSTLTLNAASVTGGQILFTGQALLGDG